MTSKHLLLSALSLLILLGGCSSYKLKKELERKAAAEALRPSWIKNDKSIDNGYFWGVGQSTKRLNSIGEVDHKDKCKKDALTQIANTISVQVDAQTMLATTSISTAMRQDFQQTVKLTSQIDLEGVELADSYEDEFAVFARYKLNIADYQAQKQRKIEGAAQRSCTQMIQAQDYRKQSDYRNAIVFYLKAIATLSYYWKENIQTTCNQTVMNPLTEADKQLRETLQSIALQPIESRVEVTTGFNLSPEFSGFTALSNVGTPLNNLPLKFQADGLILPAVNGVTQGGKCTFNFRSLPSQAKVSTITASPDMAIMIQEAQLSEDMATFARRYQLPTTQFQVVRTLPRVHYYTDNQMLSTLVSEQVKQQLAKKEVEEGTKNNSITTVEILTVKNDLARQNNYNTQSVAVRLTWIDKNKKRVERNVTVTESAMSEKEVTEKVSAAITKEIKGKTAEEIYFSLF